MTTHTQTPETSEAGDAPEKGPGRPPHAHPVEEVLGELGVEPDRGLSDDEARRRLDEHGPNRLERTETRPWWRVLLGQFKSAVILVMAAAMGVAAAFARWPETIALAAVIAVNTAIGFISEWRALRSLEALRDLGRRRSTVRRGGETRTVADAELVPGDIVVLEAEALVPADLRLIRGESVRVSEASLTGESVPVSKSPDPVDPDAPLAERACLLHHGTTLVEGRAEAVVVATGMDTELGRVSELASEAESTATPLQRRLDALGWRLAWLTLGIAAVIAGVGLAAGQPTLLMVETAIALGVAAVPEGMPIVATLALAQGMRVLARRHALINRLPAVETLGSTRVICTDKTGTLTHNRMTLARVVTDAGEIEPDSHADDPGGLPRRAVEIGVLCNNAALEDEPADRLDQDDDRGDAQDAPGDDPPDAGTSERGDPMEIALLKAGATWGMRRPALLEDQPELREVAFDPDTKMMATYHRTGDGVRVAVKGAPEAVLDACTHVAGDADDDGGGGEGRPFDDEARQAWHDRAAELASRGLRLLAAAEKSVDDEQAPPYEGLRLVGLLGLLDPPREGVRDAIDTCQRAGVSVVMVTGDQADTAESIAEDVGIVGEASDPEKKVRAGSDLDDYDSLSDAQRDDLHGANIFARVSPEQKLNLVTLFQDRGDTVAMTGDGVNDAPALKKADIGIAMGQRGTDAAKQVADMVLTDDAFETIVTAVRYGRVIFANIRRSVMFMLCTNLAEVIAVGIASVAGWPIPLRPLQILYLNVLTDVLPALALGVGPGSGDEMDRPPRSPREPVLTRLHWALIGGWGAIIAACVLAALLIGWGARGWDTPRAVTVAFMTLGLSKLWFVFNLRPVGSGLLRNPVTRNPWVWASIAVCAGLLLAAVYLPPLAAVLETEPLDPANWAVALGLSLAPLIVGQLGLLAARLWRPARPEHAEP